MTAASRADTIVAIATPPGRGGIGVVRVSGEHVEAIAHAVLGRLPEPRRAVRARFHDADGAILDEGLALRFCAPASYTGEDVLELHAHGGPVVLGLIEARIVGLGARPARPGEFTERAFLAGRIDLARAEAVADLIDAGSVAAARAAARSLTGEFSRAVIALEDRIEAMRVEVEAAIDFGHEDIEPAARDVVIASLEVLTQDLSHLLRRAAQGQLLREGRTVVIAGRPNAGKSSLLNALTGLDAAIVTPIAGTTRDLLREPIDLAGLPVTLCDTAGLRSTEDPVEIEGVRRARDAAAKADHVLYLVDGTDAEALRSLDADLATLPSSVPTSVVYTKSDLPGAYREGLHVSATSGAGIDELNAHLRTVLGYHPDEGGTLGARRRHIEALERAREHLVAAASHTEVGREELLAEELRLAHDALGDILGRVSSDDLLGSIFSAFCIGK
jgi:tRNA modification GTPase